ncbi:endocuticle structural glycoprotein SgAbd-5-like [Atheta coriaria]|uniref:endocuticle structural glycoprotein SgAbd-5-like n=1 Tax=Dalotia coriaria TaxID=877792 RepID=UPI0031F47092
MKTIIVFCAMMVLALAAPQGGKDATILKFENDVSPEGYKFAYETSDGTAREEEGTLKDLGGEDGQAIVITGSFNWKDEKTGQVYTVTFTADENGYKPNFKAAK